jgi:predicted esterase
MRSGGPSASVFVPLPAKRDEEVILTVEGKAAASWTFAATGAALHERVVKLADRAGPLVEAPGVPADSRESFAHLVDRIVRALAHGESDGRWLERQTADAESIADGLAAGSDPYRDKTGIVVRAYRSRLDGKVQPYVLFVPPSYKPDGKPLPLIVVFHGAGHWPEHALRTVIGKGPNDETGFLPAAKHMPSFPDQGALLVAPWGYDRAGPRPMGEEDVLEVIRRMQAHYRVDERRISLTGYSLGGTVSFVVPLHHPDLFSGSAPLCGYPNLLSYDSVRNVRHAPWEETMLAKRYIVNYAENGLHLPLHIVHGGLDAPSRSAVVADRYRALGYSVIFDVQDDLDHKVQDYGYEDGKMIAWLRARRRPETPSHVRLVTGELRYDHSYWVRLIAMRDGELRGESGPELADIDATWKKEAGELLVTTRNVAAFALDVRALGVPSGARAVVDGKAEPIPDGAETLFFAREGASHGGWSLLEREPSREGKKRPGVAGPLDDVLRHRSLVVFGTLDPAQTESNRLVAEHFSSFETYSAAHFPVKADVDVGEGELAGQSLVLVGAPGSNRITKMLADALPVHFDGGAIVVRGQRYEGEDVGVSFIAPNPRDANEYVVVHAGIGPRGTLASRHIPQLAPDYLVYDGRMTSFRGDVLLGKREALAGGFFDDDWR